MITALAMTATRGSSRFAYLSAPKKSLLTHEITVAPVWPGTHEGEAHGSLCAFALHGVDAAGRRPPLHVGIDGSVPQANLPRLAGTSTSIINPSDTSHSRRKTDRLDARKLAHHEAHLTGLWHTELGSAPHSPSRSFGVLTARKLRARLVSERTSSNQSDQRGDVAASDTPSARLVRRPAATSRGR